MSRRILAAIERPTTPALSLVTRDVVEHFVDHDIVEIRREVKRGHRWVETPMRWHGRPETLLALADKARESLAQRQDESEGETLEATLGAVAAAVKGE